VRSTAKLSIKTKIARHFLLNFRPAGVASAIKKIVGIERIPIETDLGRFFVDPVSHVGDLLLSGGDYDPAITRTLKQYLSPGNVFVDIGANEGFFAVIGAKLVGSTGRTIAVEPQERLRPVLEKNFELNEIDNVELFTCAISDQNGTNVIHISPDISTGSTGFYRRSKYKVPTQVVETRTLSALFDQANIDRADVLKMDIEGFEYEAIFGSPEIFRDKRVQILALDLHPDYLAMRGQGVEKILQFLAECGYKLDESFGNTIWIAG